MIKKIIFFILAFFLSAALYGQSMYVSSLKTSLYSNPDPGAKKIADLKKGDELQFVSSNGQWVQVKYGSVYGWVKKLFVSNTKPGNKISILSNAKTNENVHIRKRASSDVTAASARGLAARSDESQARFRGDQNKLEIAEGYQILEKIELLEIKENDLIRFLADEKINE